MRGQYQHLIARGPHPDLTSRDIVCGIVFTRHRINPTNHLILPGISQYERLCSLPAVGARRENKGRYHPTGTIGSQLEIQRALLRETVHSESHLCPDRVSRVHDPGNLQLLQPDIGSSDRVTDKVGVDGNPARRPASERLRQYSAVMAAITDNESRPDIVFLMMIPHMDNRQAQVG